MELSGTSGSFWATPRAERALNRRQVLLLHEFNKSGAFSESVMPKSSVGMEDEFMDCLGCLLCAGNVSRITSIKNQ